MAKKSVSILLNVICLLDFFSFEKRTCAYLSAHEMGRRPRKGRYLHSSVATLLWFFSFLCKKICASLYTSPHAEYMCIHGDGKGEAEEAKRRVSALFRGHHPLVLLFPLQEKMCILIRTLKWAEDPGMCAGMADEKRTKKKGKRKRRKRKEGWKEEEKKEKGKELRRYPLFALLFAFLCFAFLCSFCSSFWI